MYLKAPYIKGKNYCPNPIVKYGIPKYADSRRDPKVIGTVAWEQFWEEQIMYIHQGYNTGGMWIPGRYYYYMNFTVIGTDDGPVNPDPTDLHLEYAYIIEHAKLQGLNVIVPKGRRRGLSEASQSMIVDYGWRFKDGYKAGVAAGQKVYTEDFIDKWSYANSNLPPELSTKTLLNNTDQIIAGYNIRNSFGAFEEQGSRNTIYCRTMHLNPNMFKGLYLSDVIAEEVGEFEKFLEFFSATKDCLKSGNIQKGSMFAYGTGGKMDKGSKDFKHVWYNAHNFNFIKFLVPATRFYFYGGAKIPSKRLPVTSELYKSYRDYQLSGVEDLILAEKAILEIRAGFLKDGNLKAYNEDLQNNPLNETEIFRKTVVNNFDTQKLNAQQAEIDALEHPKWTKYKMQWAKDDKGMMKTPLEVIITPIKPYEDQDECIWIIDSERPRKGYQNLYTAGIDSYDQDKAVASKSLGAMCIRIRANNILHAMSQAPVAVICCRPKRKEKFYEMCVMASVYYKLVGNVLGDVSTALIINTFKDLGCGHYLADRPRKFEAENSDQTHEKWVRLTNFSRPRMTGLMQTDIVDNVHNNWFSELINQLGNFDEVEIGSDNDLADAYGFALMQDVSCDVRPRDQNAEDIDDRFSLDEFVSDRNGELFMKGQRPDLLSEQQDHELFGR